MSTVKIINGRILSASDTFTADIYIENGVVSHIARGLPMPADRTIDAAGQIVMPGGIDVHTHLDMPFGGTMSADDFRTGTTAAAHGGTTSVIDFAIQTRGKGLYHAFDEWRGKAEGKAVIDYAFHMIVLDLNDQVYDEMHRLATNDGLTSFKLFMAYPGVLMVDDGTIFKVMLQARESGGLICMHAENGHAIDTLVQRARARGQMAPKYHALTRPPQAEAEATHRALALAEMAGAPIYIVHVTCNDSMSKIAAQRERGLPAYGETCTQYLFLSYEDYERPGFEGAKFVMSPPLRDKSNQPLLWKGLRRNDLQIVSTDHCPFCDGGSAAEATGQGRLLEDPQRRAGHRGSPADALGRRRAHGTDQRTAFRGDRLDEPGEDVRPLAAQGHDCRGRGCRHRDLGSESAAHDLGEDASHACRLQPVRRTHRDGCAVCRVVAGRGHR